MWFVGKKELVKSLKEISYNVPQQRWECDILAYYNLCISLTIPLDDLNDRLETVQISTYAKQDPRLRLQCSSSIKRKLTTTRHLLRNRSSDHYVIEFSFSRLLKPPHPPSQKAAYLSHHSQNPTPSYQYQRHYYPMTTSQT